MDNSINNDYKDYKVYNITKIKNKYGFRIKLIHHNDKATVIQKSGYKTLKEAESIRNNIIGELCTKTFIINESISVKDFFTYWLENIMRKKITSSSYDAYKNIVYNHIIPYFKNMKLSTIDRSHIQKFYNMKAEFSHSITRSISIVIHTSLNYAVDKNYIKVNPSDNIILPKKIKNKAYRKTNINSAETLTEEQVKILLLKAKDTPIYLQVLFAVLMGLRRSEINGLKYSDIDYARRKIHVQRQLGVLPNSDISNIQLGKFTKQDIKTKSFSSDRILNIPDILFEEILNRKILYEKQKKRRINDKLNPFYDYDYIVCSSYGNPRSKSYHFKYWKQLLKISDLPDMRFHDLRKTYCTLLLSKDFNTKAVSMLMGHATEIITVDVYGDKQQLVRDCTNEIQSFINRVVPQHRENICDLKNDEEINNIIEDKIEYLVN